MADVIEAFEAVDGAIQEAKALRRFLKKGSSVQVSAQGECAQAKATAFAWLRNHRPVIASCVEDDALEEVDRLYNSVLASSDRHTSRSKYDEILKRVLKELPEIREHVIQRQQSGVLTGDEPPTFSRLVKDNEMQEVLGRRWEECCKCLDARAPLASTVMMGGLLEALLLGRVNQETDKAKVFQAKFVPKDRSGKTCPLKDWTLRNYIDVAHELGWIAPSAKDVGAVLRDYRNYIHPHKERSHGVALSMEDAEMFWEITKRISRQLLA